MSNDTAGESRTEYILLKTQSNNEYVIGTVHDINDESIIVNYPLAIKIMENQEGTVNLFTTKFLPFSRDNKVLFNVDMIVCTSPPSQELINHYNKFVNRYHQIFDKQLEPELLNQSTNESDETELDNELDEIDNDIRESINSVSNNTIH